jgi:hypothetical protein
VCATPIAELTVASTTACGRCNINGGSGDPLPPTTVARDLPQGRYRVVPVTGAFSYRLGLAGTWGWNLCARHENGTGALWRTSQNATNEAEALAAARMVPFTLTVPPGGARMHFFVDDSHCDDNVGILHLVICAL